MAGGTVETLWPLRCVSVIVVIVVVNFLFMEAVHSFWVEESPVSTRCLSRFGATTCHDAKSCDNNYIFTECTLPHYYI